MVERYCVPEIVFDWFGLKNVLYVLVTVVRNVRNKLNSVLHSFRLGPHIVLAID